jgi:hypothetical protein
MAEVTAESLKQVQSRVKALQSTRDQIMRQQAVQEQKRDEAYKNLRELGVENPETMTAKQLMALAETKKAELGEKVSALEGQLAQGETLIQKYQDLQQEG